MDVRQILLDTESALRDFVTVIMKQQYGDDWIYQSGLSDDRLDILSKKQESASKTRISMQEENRVLNQSNLIDLKTIITRNWVGDFELCFGDLNTVGVYLSTLHRYYDSDANNRAMLTHQKHLILGISGFLRNRMVVYRSWKDGDKQGFPKIESVRDNLGNLWVPGKPRKIKTGLSIRPGDNLEFVVTAKDPEERDLEYRIFPNKWTSSNVLLTTITEKQISAQTIFHIGIRSSAKHHAFPLGYDDRVTFEYEVLPG